VTGYFPELEDYNTGPDAYLGLIEGAKRALAVPVIASLNGHSAGGWTRYASLFEEAGADAIELNVYFLATDPNVSSAEVEQRYVDLVASVVAAGVGPGVGQDRAVLLLAGRTSRCACRRRRVGTGAVQPLRAARRDPRGPRGCAAPGALHVRGVAPGAALDRHPAWSHRGVARGEQRGAPAEDALKLLLAGADVVQVASSLIQRGPYHVESLLRGMQAWLEEGEYESVAQMRGSLSQRNVPDPEAFERANYMRALVTYTSERT
jgi:dihydroorotate dehydrogenase (fumarate)